MTNQTPLNYAGDSHTESVTWHGREVRIELGPMSTTTFVTTIIPVSVWLILSLGVTGLAIAGMSVCLGVVGISSSLGALAMLIMLWQHRSAPRQVWASSRHIAFSDARTSGVPRVFDAHKYKPVRTARSLWRPWLCHLTAAPDVSPFLPTEKKILTLLTDTDRRRLREFAKLIEVARSIPEDEGHVRGAFEVLPVKPPQSESPGG